MDESYSPQDDSDVRTERDQLETSERIAYRFNWWSLLSWMVALIVALTAYSYISSERQWNRERWRAERSRSRWRTRAADRLPFSRSGLAELRHRAVAQTGW